MGGVAKRVTRRLSLVSCTWDRPAQSSNGLATAINHMKCLKNALAGTGGMRNEFWSIVCWTMDVVAKNIVCRALVGDW